MGAKRWTASSEGPDWVDVAISMREIEHLHGVLLTFTLGLGVFDGPSMLGTIAALRCPSEGNIMGEPILALGVEFPCKDHKTLESCVYHGLYEIDYLLARKVWKQLSLPFTAP